MYHKTLISCTDFCLTFVLADGVLIQGLMECLFKARHLLKRMYSHKTTKLFFFFYNSLIF